MPHQSIGKAQILHRQSAYGIPGIMGWSTIFYLSLINKTFMQHLLHFYRVTAVILLSYLTSAAQTYLPDATFQSLLVKKYAGGINAITVQSDQKILLAGYMDYLDDTPAESIMRLRPDGSI